MTSCLLASRHSGHMPQPLRPGLMWPVGLRGQFLMEPGHCAVGGNGSQDTGEQLVLPPSTGQRRGVARWDTCRGAVPTPRGCPEPSPLPLGLVSPPPQAESTECWERREAGGPGEPGGRAETSLLKSNPLTSRCGGPPGLHPLSCYPTCSELPSSAHPLLPGPPVWAPPAPPSVRDHGPLCSQTPPVSAPNPGPS